MLWLLDHASESGVFNLGTGTARSFRDLMNASAPPAGLRRSSNMSIRRRRSAPNYQYFTEAVIGKLRLAGYGARFTPLEEAVRDFVTRHLASGRPVSVIRCS